MQTNAGGKKVNKKVVIFDSDDWGSIRMPDRQTYEELLNLGIRVDKCPYNRNDSLESEEDIQVLLDTLNKFKDRYGNHPIFNLNIVVANPDFEKMATQLFGEYYYEPFIQTYGRFSGKVNSFDLIIQGIKHSLFSPHFHGREHLNVSYWLTKLKEGNNVFIEGFKRGVFGFGPGITGDKSFNIQAALNSYNPGEIVNHKNILNDGIRLFTTIFGTTPDSYIANNYTWDSKLNETLSFGGIKVLKCMKYQVMPKYSSEKRFIRRRTGEKNQYGQIYLVRNVTFEPAQMHDSYDNVGVALKDIDIAFRMKKPAVIDTHRINYIGSINEKNRYSGITQLNELIAKILKYWPDVEFMSISRLLRLNLI
ncbi:MAG: hypothetical protein L6Q59_04500 [Ignavibacteriaceae bacterium]|nr:hypothetical protein [Ignavibacteriaceae bacterium]